MRRSTSSHGASAGRAEIFASSAVSRFDSELLGVGSWRGSGTERNGTSFNSEKRRNGGNGGTRSNDEVHPMPPRVRGEQSTDAPRPQAAGAINRGLSPRGVGRFPGPAGRPGRHRLRTLKLRRFGPFSPFLRFSELKLVPFPPSPPSRAQRDSSPSNFSIASITTAGWSSGIQWPLFDAMMCSPRVESLASASCCRRR